MNKNVKDKNIEYLLKAILKIESLDECFNFFDDLCTINEIKAMSQRFVVAKMLKEHHVYSDIVEKTGASTATISRVNRSLLYGSDGYNSILAKMEDEK